LRNLRVLCARLIFFLRGYDPGTGFKAFR
jgi:hypothetical protein